jgi:hypothetical protein
MGTGMRQAFVYSVREIVITSPILFTTHHFATTNNRIIIVVNHHPPLEKSYEPQIKMGSCM